MGLKMQPDTASIIMKLQARRGYVQCPLEARKAGLKAGLSRSLKAEIIGTRWRATAHRRLHSAQTPDRFHCPWL